MCITGGLLPKLRLEELRCMH